MPTHLIGKTFIYLGRKATVIKCCGGQKIQIQFESGSTTSCYSNHYWEK